MAKLVYCIVKSERSSLQVLDCPHTVIVFSTAHITQHAHSYTYHIVYLFFLLFPQLHSFFFFFAKVLLWNSFPVFRLPEECLIEFSGPRKRSGNSGFQTEINPALLASPVPQKREAIFLSFILPCIVFQFAVFYGPHCLRL